MLIRTPEPETMSDELEVAAYDQMSHSAVNQKCVDDFLAACPHLPLSARVLDLGTGTALIPLLLLEKRCDLQITAVDQSAAMLDLAARHINIQQRTEQLHLLEADSCALPLPDHSFAAVISNSLIHHLPDPLRCLQEALRVLVPGGMLWIRDLFRPETSAMVEHLVQTYAGEESSLQQQLLRQSLHAAYRVEEIQNLFPHLPRLQARVQLTSDRHWTLVGYKQQ